MDEMKCQNNINKENEKSNTKKRRKSENVLRILLPPVNTEEDCESDVDRPLSEDNSKTPPTSTETNGVTDNGQQKQSPKQSQTQDKDKSGSNNTNNQEEDKHEPETNAKSPTIPTSVRDAIFESFSSGESSAMLASSHLGANLASYISSKSDLPKSSPYLEAALKLGSSRLLSPTDGSFPKLKSETPVPSPSPPSRQGHSRSLSTTPPAANTRLTDIKLEALRESMLTGALFGGASLGPIETEMELARQHLSSVIRGMPLLQMLPALQQLVPGANMQGSSRPGSVSVGSGGILCVCGIRFTNTNNLEAHQMFYCTHRQGQGESSEQRERDSSSVPLSTSPTKEEEGRLLRCPHCTYTTTHKLSLNGHMNIHTNPEEAATTAPTPTSNNSAETRTPECYCSDCDIQFSSMKTYTVHKTHYCQTRHVLKGNKSPARDESVPNSSQGSLPGLGNSGQPVLALPTNPVLLVPYSLVAGAQLLPSHFLNQHNAAFVLPNGQVHPLPTSIPTTSTSAIPPLFSLSNLAAKSTETTTTSSTSPTASLTKTTKSDIKEKTPTKRRGEGECPLDLTTKRPKLSIKSDLLNDEEKENREVNPRKSKSPTSKNNSNFASPTGEFEGKLLASPPRQSPSSDTEDRSTPKSPRPASAAPSLCSPRSLAESPRPSTSAAKSPGRGSPGALPHQTSLTPNFPNLLSSLENLGNIQLANLQALSQGLQGMSPEVALKLLNPELMMNSLQPMMTPPVIVKQGEAKCNECNIVFFKEESLQIHKKHYCAARENKNSEDDKRSTGSRSPGSAVEPTPSNHSPPREPATVSAPAVSPNKDTKPIKPLVQFICTACGIKFTSPDNLSAHQTYYCPKREGASTEEGVTKGMWRCPRCRVSMTETLQAAHQCVAPNPVSSHGWRCPCCPVLSPTAAAAQKHLDTHAGIKAFRCKICGYRGNTLRGMRTHIRMHFEKRTSDLQEEAFIACILEGEENRPKNSNISDVSRILLDNPNLSALLADSSMNEQLDPPLMCKHCPFTTPQKSVLLQHISLAHKFDPALVHTLHSLFEEQLKQEKKKRDSNDRDSPENGNSNSPPLPSIKLEPEVKLEVQDTDEDDSLKDSQPTTSSTESHKSLLNGSPPRPSGSSTLSHCQTCNITFAYPANLMVHKQYYCKRQESNTPPETAVQ